MLLPLWLSRSPPGSLHGNVRRCAGRGEPHAAVRGVKQSRADGLPADLRDAGCSGKKKLNVLGGVSARWRGACSRDRRPHAFPSAVATSGCFLLEEVGGTGGGCHGNEAEFRSSSAEGLDAVWGYSALKDSNGSDVMA